MEFRAIYRISVITPSAAVEAVVESIAGITPLAVGNYDSVHWIIDGVRERFRPLAGARPTRGRIGELHEEASCWLVFAIPRDPDLLARVIDDGIRSAHPWESPSIFVDESVHPVD